ncbi:MAG: class I SAM-dependent methyltransferase [Burkholderiales bacterium]|nr:class I SAM-dependent methyltransferase [Burkholderiales bacterium]
MLSRLRDIAHAAAAVFAAVVLSCAPVRAAEPFKPQVGQAGKDVIWVPTPERAVERMLRMARVGPADFLVDLGSGDGRIVIAAAKDLGARGFGVDLNPDMVKLSQYRAQQAGVSERARFYLRDIFQTDLRQASVVTMFLLPELNMRLRPALLQLAPGTRIVAHAFDLGEWEADEIDTATGSTLRLWVVPAAVAGRWTWSMPANGTPRRFALDMNQQYQRVGGVVMLGQQRLRLRDGRLRGDELSFVLLEQSRADQGVRYDYTGRVSGDAITGEMTSSEDGKRTQWSALRRSDH